MDAKEVQKMINKTIIKNNISYLAGIAFGLFVFENIIKPKIDGTPDTITPRESK
jgi:hypothetical protein